MHKYSFVTDTNDTGGAVMSEDKKQAKNQASDEQAVRENLSREYDHEQANEPLTPEETYNNKKTKKRQ